MHPVIESILTTRAMRRFTAEPVADADIEACLQAAQQAPSGGNVQPQQYVVVTDPELRAKVGDLYRLAFDRYEATLPAPESFPDEKAAASWARNRDASRHLADHLGEVPVLVLFLQPIVPWGGEDAEGPLDIGRLDASVYPAVQNFCLRRGRSAWVPRSPRSSASAPTRCSKRSACRPARTGGAASRSPRSCPSGTRQARSGWRRASRPRPSPIERLGQPAR